MDQPRVPSWLGSPWEIPSNYAWGTHQGLQDDFFSFPVLCSITSCCCKDLTGKPEAAAPFRELPSTFQSVWRGGLGRCGLASSPPSHGQSSLKPQGLLNKTALLPGSSARNLPFGTADIQCEIKVFLWVCEEYFRLVKSTDAHGHLP